MMDFGKILNQWEQTERGRRKSGSEKDRERMESWLDAYPPDAAADDVSEPHDSVRNAQERARLRALPAQRVLDLHGKTGREAGAALTRFLERARADGLEKVLVVHGKGNHSREGRSLLKSVVRNVLQESPVAGETGTPPRDQGGSGATWVILRHRSR